MRRAGVALSAALAILHGAHGARQKLAVPEEFDLQATKALNNISSSFEHFIAAARSGAQDLAKKLKEQQSSLISLAAATVPGAKSLEDVKAANDALRERAKKLMKSNEGLRQELLQARRQLNEDFSSQNTLSTEADEAALVDGADHPAPIELPRAEAQPMVYHSEYHELANDHEESLVSANQGSSSSSMSASPLESSSESLGESDEAPPVPEPEQQWQPSSQTQGQSIEDVMKQQVAKEALLQVSSSDKEQAPQQATVSSQVNRMVVPAAPAAQTGDVGYAEAFAAGDADGADWGDDQGNWQSLLSLGAKHRRLRNHAAASTPPTVAAATQGHNEHLWPAAVAFAKLEGAGIQQVQDLYDAAIKKVEKQRVELLEQKATHARLEAAVSKLEATHQHLLQRSKNLLGLLKDERASSSAQVSTPQEEAAAAMAAAERPRQPGQRHMQKRTSLAELAEKLKAIHVGHSKQKHGH